jgi:hypothetical protein
VIRSWLLAAALALCLVGAAARGAEARAEKTLAYPRDQAWSAALRFLVVDERVKVTDKDADAGYVTFELKDDGKMWRGSLELVSVDQDGRKAILFVMQLADRPTWEEQQLLDRLERKLRVELGAPTPPATKKPDPPKDESPPKDEPKKPDAPPKSGDDDGPPISPTP